MEASHTSVPPSSCPDGAHLSQTGARGAHTTRPARLGAGLTALTDMGKVFPGPDWFFSVHFYSKEKNQRLMKSSIHTACQTKLILIPGGDSLSLRGCTKPVTLQ